jgi:hypothetical protein
MQPVTPQIAETHGPATIGASPRRGRVGKFDRPTHTTAVGLMVFRLTKPIGNSAASSAQHTYLGRMRSGPLICGWPAPNRVPRAGCLSNPEPPRIVIVYDHTAPRLVTPAMSDGSAGQKLKSAKLIRPSL